MSNSNVVELNKPVEDLLSTVLKQDTRQMLAAAIEAEVHAFLKEYADLQVDGRRAVVLNGYLPERTAQTGLGDIEVKVTNTRDRSWQAVHFNSQLIPPYLKRTKAMEEFILWLYLNWGHAAGSRSDSR